MTSSSEQSTSGPSGGNGQQPAAGDGQGDLAAGERQAATGDAAAAAHSPLPRPERERWQPLRAGLVDVFFYDREEFWFRDGRLLLRGNNGTGKSKVLALTLPFLLDGDVSPARVEPDGDRHKRMEWNLLLDGRHTERTGYTWLELGRLDADGRPRYLTLGCGLKAVAGKGAPARWFFATGQRVGVDLWLATEAGTAKTKDRLADALDDEARLVEQPGAWRRLVDEALFGLGEERYEALLRLLLQLRQPQLSRRPDEGALAAALTEALPPPDQDMVHDVADAFRSLEADRAELDGLKETRAHVADFAERYARAAGVATRRAAEVVRTAQSAYETVGRERADAAEQLDAAQGDEAAATAERDRHRDELASARAEDRALRDSQAMDDARQLEREEQLAAEAEGDAEAAGERADEAERAHADAQQAATDAEAELAARRDELDAALAAADAAAEAAGLADGHRTVLTDHPDDDAAAAHAGEDLAARRRDQVAHVRRLAETAARRADEEAAARRRREDAAGDRDTAAEAQADQAETVRAAAAELTAATRRWAEALVELGRDGGAGDAEEGGDGDEHGRADGHERAEEHPLDPETLEAAVAEWAERADGASPLATAVRDGHARATARLAEAEERRAAHERTVRAERDDAAGERDDLAAGGVLAPPAPHTRDPEARADRAGAPLWQLVDFADDVGESERAGLEAALEAGGLLDAWVTPDGALLETGTHDVVVTAEPPAGRSLARALRPAVDPDDPHAAAVPASAVEAVLAGIGLDAGTQVAPDGDGASDGDLVPTWVAFDGRFRVGPLAGAWGKDAAAHVGHAAREQTRRARIAELDAALADLDEQLRRAAAEAERLTARRTRLDHEVATAPDERPLADAHATLAERAAAAHRAQERLDARETEVAEAADAARQAAADRDDAAGDLRLPADLDALAEAAEAVSAYRQACAGLWPARRSHRQALAARDRARAQAAQAGDAAGRRRDEARQARTRAGEARTRADTLRGQVGATVAELEAALSALAERITDLEQRAEAAEQTRGDAHDRVVRLTERVRGLDERAAQATADRDEAVAAFQRFAATGLVAAAADDVEALDPHGQAWAADPTVRLCRRLEQRLAHLDTSDEAWQCADTDLQHRFGDLAEVLSRHGHHAELRREAEAPVVDVTFHRRRLSPGETAAVLDGDIADRERLLSHREREVLEDQLVAEVAAHLSERIAGAESQLARLNHELDERPTSTGMRLGLRWVTRDDAPPGLAEARRRLLRQRAEAWSDEDRAAVGAFLQDQIERVRAEREEGTWVEHLTEALDYRRWHTFVVERRRDGGWTRALGPASGGERALAMTLPMLAAASSFYDSAANESAPRLIMLDEAFAGIDADARAKCLGLLAEFGLDVVATSEREWGATRPCPAWRSPSSPASRASTRCTCPAGSGTGGVWPPPSRPCRRCASPAGVTLTGPRPTGRRRWTGRRTSRRDAHETVTDQPAPEGEGRTAATDSEVDPDRLAALLGDAGLAWLVDRCVRRLGRGRALTGSVTKQHATDDERAAVARLLGRAPRRGASLTVALDDVEAALRRARAAPSLAAAVEALRGDVTGEAAAATARQQAWQRVLDEAQAWAADQPWQARWLERLRADGLLVRLTGGDPDAAAGLLAICRRVFAALPAGGRSRSVLAADVTGDGHALDDGTALATLVLRGAAELAGPAAGLDAAGRATADAASRRELWAAVGVTVDPLASQVAVLNLPAAATSPTGTTLATLAGAGEPAVLTLRQVVGESIAFDVAGTIVSVCENPSVLGAAADRLGAASAPLVCLDGHPSTAAQLLLDQLVAAGARVRVHADFDWAGLRIAGAALARTGGRPWRLGAADYEAAAHRSTKPLVGTPAATPWDPALAAALRARDVAVEEELMLDELLADMASG